MSVVFGRNNDRTELNTFSGRNKRLFFFIFKCHHFNENAPPVHGRGEKKEKTKKERERKKSFCRLPPKAACACGAYVVFFSLLFAQLFAFVPTNSAMISVLVSCVLSERKKKRVSTIDLSHVVLFSFAVVTAHWKASRILPVVFFSFSRLISSFFLSFLYIYIYIYICFL